MLWGLDCDLTQKLFLRMMSASTLLIKILRYKMPK